MKRTITLAAIVLLTAASMRGAKEKGLPYDPGLPALGTKFHELPKGDGKSKVEAACMACHSADMLAQQRLTEKQWTAEVEKMTRWGAAVKDADKSVVIAYLTRHFGTGNQFKAYRTRPVGR